MNKPLLGAMCAMALSSCQPPESGSGVKTEYLDTTVRAGDNFFQYATGNWINYNPQPAEHPRWGSFTKLGEDNILQINELITSIAKSQNEKGSIAQKIGDLYNLYMDTVRMEKEGAAPIMPFLEEIRVISSRSAFIDTCAVKHHDLFFNIYLGADCKNSSMNIVEIGQGGLTLRDRDYYLADDEKTVRVREAYKKRVVNLFKLCGLSEEEAQKRMETVLRIETELAKIHLPRVELRDPEANYHKMTIKELADSTSGFDWVNYFKKYTYDQTTEVDLGQIAPVRKGCELLMTAPLEDLKVIYEWSLINQYSNLMSDAFVQENFAFNQVLTGAKELRPRWKRAISYVDDVMSDAVGQMYVEKYFPKENKERMLELVKDLQVALADRIKAQEWMSDSTKEVALDKLASFYVKIGYPDKWDDLTELIIDPNLSLVENHHRASQFYWDLNKSKKYNKPVDRDEWHMSPQTVNAYYNPTTNEICFPAGILQPPFFNMQADDACNYGAIGVGIGHEMTHGFDDQGRQFDKEGNLKVWWNEKDVERFKVPAEQLAVYFDSLKVLPDLNANGHLCLGENIADHGGLNVAFAALQKAMQKRPLGEKDGFTPEQRFFLSYANVWAGVSTEEIIRHLTKVDVHSINFLRVNGTLPHIDAWYDAFNIQPGDSLYLPKEERVKIW
ncbi:MAG: M13 family metallopeptidase [Paludibacteraceae bacterium]|nr:M13 family metallopeptidase [Paludibacteraceae bacterium]